MINSADAMIQSKELQPYAYRQPLPLFDSSYTPSVKLLRLLELVGMPSLNKLETAVVQINRFAQENLLRKGERWEEQTTKFEALKPLIKPLLSALGFVEARKPQFTEYQGAIVHGALLPRVRLRLYYLIEEWKKGILFSKIYFLSGERPLDSKLEGIKAMSDDERSPLKIRKDWLVPKEFPKTECEMMQLVWEQSEIPEEMRDKVTVHFINAPMKANAKGEKTIRPTTDDTVEAWLKSKPASGRYLAASNAPYSNRQDFVLKSLIPDEYSVDTVGPAADKSEKAAIFLDELARYIFQIKQLSEK